MTKVIIGINVAVYLLTSVGRSGADLQNRLVLFGPDVAHGELYRLVTSGFVHFGVIHILFNMVLLYRFGEALERNLGRTRYFLLFSAALLTGSFGALLLTPHAATGGASGAVFGLMGAVAMGMRQRGVSLTEGGVGGLIAINLVLSVVIPGISLGGHLGGLIGGAVVGGVMLRTAPSDQSMAESITAAVAVIALAVVGSVLVA